MKNVVWVGVLVCVLSLGVLPGCALFSPRFSEGIQAYFHDNAMIRATLDHWKAAIEAGDVDRIMRVYSENFRSGDKDKAAFKKHLDEEMESWRGKDVKVVYETADITIEDDRAKVIPIGLDRRDGARSLWLELAKENGKWLIVNQGQ
jgi:ketosteroid isomerase-like protein